MGGAAQRSNRRLIPTSDPVGHQASMGTQIDQKLLASSRGALGGSTSNSARSSTGVHDLLKRTAADRNGCEVSPRWPSIQREENSYA
jgi:hypothetical protein